MVTTKTAQKKVEQKTRTAFNKANKKVEKRQFREKNREELRGLKYKK